MDSVTVSGKKGMNISKAYSEDLFFSELINLSRS